MTETAFPIELDIEGLEVKEVKINRKEHYEIYVESILEGGTCRECGKHIERKLNMKQ
ncbi:hypothetical protein [Candidatus Parabeggiatoa sp. HSG14]|uniref:hypothetical protein n=1 Tax=Candidatus Parabeggiatoa sp. HSG14 TaxID=3055593 RepID=UPI0025A81AD9|nr:hypothetical protein [Thiotrichales bacterium HSG14]